MEPERASRDERTDDRTIAHGRPPSRLWKVLHPVVLVVAVLLATLGIPIILRDPARQAARTAEVAPRDDDPERVP